MELGGLTERRFIFQKKIILLLFLEIAKDSLLRVVELGTRQTRNEKAKNASSDHTAF